MSRVSTFRPLLFWGRHFTPDWTTPRCSSSKSTTTCSFSLFIIRRPKSLGTGYAGEAHVQVRVDQKTAIHKRVKYIHLYISTKSYLSNLIIHLIIMSYYLSLFYFFSDVLLEHLPFLNLCKIPTVARNKRRPSLRFLGCGRSRWCGRHLLGCRSFRISWAIFPVKNTSKG